MIIRAVGIIERDLRKFFRSPMLMVASLVLPLVQLVVLGNAFGGNIRNVQLAVVDQDHGPSSVLVREKLQAVAANARTFVPHTYATQAQAIADLRAGEIGAVIIIPPSFSRDLAKHLQPQLALLTDNTDRFISSSVEGVMTQMTAALNQPAVAPHAPPSLTLETVELYPYISYMKFLLPGSITLAIFVTAMIGGGILYIDDKARGLHEGYLVTPITKWELILGFITSGVIKAIIAGMVVMLLGAAMAGVGSVLEPTRLLMLLGLTIVSSLALISMMFFLMSRVSDPLVPRAVFGVLNTLLFFPSGAIYPQAAFPGWMRAIAIVDPFTYCVHGYRTLLLKGTGFMAVTSDLAILAIISALMLAGTTFLFRRTL